MTTIFFYLQRNDPLIEGVAATLDVVKKRAPVCLSVRLSVSLSSKRYSTRPEKVTPTPQFCFGGDGRVETVSMCDIRHERK